MANRYATKDGNWSDVTVWDGGTTLPGASDDVWSNGYRVTIDQDITVNSLQNNSNSGKNTSTSKRFGFTGSTARVINGNIKGTHTGSNNTVLELETNCDGITLVINGNIYGGNPVALSYSPLVLDNADSNVTINGDVYVAEGSSADYAISVFNDAGISTATLTINGDIKIENPATTSTVSGALQTLGTNLDVVINGAIFNLDPTATTGTTYQTIYLGHSGTSILNFGTQTIRGYNKGNVARIFSIGSNHAVTVTAGTYQASTVAPVLQLGNGGTNCQYVVNGDLKTEGKTYAHFLGNAGDATGLTTLNGDVYRSSATTMENSTYTLKVDGNFIMNGDIKAGGYSTAIYVTDDSDFTLNGTVYGQGDTATGQRGILFKVAKTKIPYIHTVICGTLQNNNPVIDQYGTNAGIEVNNFTQAYPAITLTDGGLHYMADGEYTFYTKAGVAVPLNTDGAGAQPLESKVLTGTSYGVGKTGTLTLPLEATVLADIDYGEDGTSHTGTLESGGGAVVL